MSEAVRSVRGHTVVASREHMFGNAGTFVAFEPPISLEILEEFNAERTEGTLRMYKDSRTDIFLTDENALELFGESMYVMTHQEIGEQLLLRLTEKKDV